LAFYVSDSSAKATFSVSCLCHSRLVLIWLIANASSPNDGHHGDHKEDFIIDFPEPVAPYKEVMEEKLEDVQSRHLSGITEIGAGPAYGAPRYALKKPYALTVSIPGVPLKGTAYQKSGSESEQKPSHWSLTTASTEKPQPAILPKFSVWSATTRSSSTKVSRVAAAGARPWSSSTRSTAMSSKRNDAM
jgi:hypothetical protein